MEFGMVTSFKQQPGGIVQLIVWVFLLVDWACFVSFCVVSMASPFKIPKKKQPAGSDSAHMHMQSPLSRLQSSTPELKVVLLIC